MYFIYLGIPQLGKNLQKLSQPISLQECIYFCRTVTIRDAINDLPNICNGDEIQVKNYSLEPLTHFQRMIRKNSNYLTDHVCKLHQKAKW